jgi:hypothetical protein
MLADAYLARLDMDALVVTLLSWTSLLVDVD